MMNRQFIIKKTTITRFVLLWIFILWAVFPAKRLQAATRFFQPDDDLVIVIDAGHGGENQGTIENGFQEKDMTLKTAYAMYEELGKYEGITVYMTRENDVDLTLKERAEFAESVNADFFFSIHYNASASHDLFGAEVWIPHKLPYYTYGYQFAAVELEELKSMGMFLRGIKTRVEDNDREYYGIIRENLELSIPAVIIEHCHVDCDVDSVMCDSDKKLASFGIADATAVAKYFGLKSETLGVDYGKTYTDYAKINANSRDEVTLNTKTPPEVCKIESKHVDEENGVIDVEITAADYDSVLLYYDYSIDGGKTFYPPKEWPDCDALSGAYRDVETVSIQIPPGVKPKIIFRSYNMYGQYTESNTIELLNVFYYDVTSKEMKAVQEDGVLEDDVIGVWNKNKSKNTPNTTTFRPDEESADPNAKNEVYIEEYVKLAVALSCVLIGMVLSIQLFLSLKKAGKKRRHRPKF